MIRMAQDISITPMTLYEQRLALELSKRRFVPDRAACVPEEPRVCHDTDHCGGCPYMADGFVCWSGVGECLREFTERKTAAGRRADINAGNHQQ